MPGRCPFPCPSGWGGESYGRSITNPRCRVTVAMKARKCRFILQRFSRRAVPRAGSGKCAFSYTAGGSHMSFNKIQQHQRGAGPSAHQSHFQAAAWGTSHRFAPGGLGRTRRILQRRTEAPPQRNTKQQLNANSLHAHISPLRTRGGTRGSRILGPDGQV